MKKKVMFVTEGMMDGEIRKIAYPGVVDTAHVVKVESCQGDKGDLVGLTFSTGDKRLAEGRVNDWLEDVPDLWCVKIGERLAVDGLGQANYFHSRAAAREYADSYRYVEAEITVCEVPEAARRWMLAGIRVW